MDSWGKNDGEKNREQKVKSALH